MESHTSKEGLDEINLLVADYCEAKIHCSVVLAPYKTDASEAFCNYHFVA